MSELSFAQSFLALLDTKPTNISADHVQDARTHSPGPPYILPRMPKPMSRRRANPSSTPGAERSVTVAVRSMTRTSATAPPIDVRLPSLPPSTTSVLDVKTAVAARAGIDAARLRLLFNKKPAADAKTLRDLLHAGRSDRDGGVAAADWPDAIEFSVMVMGGAGASAGAKKEVQEHSEPVVAQGISGRAVLDTDEFWLDLKGFLQQRLRDEKVAEEACRRFKAAWKSSS